MGPASTGRPGSGDLRCEELDRRAGAVHDRDGGLVGIIGVSTNLAAALRPPLDRTNQLDMHQVAHALPDHRLSAADFDGEEGAST